MPFVYPANRGSEQHVVLLAVDPRRQEIRYFDPKGLYSDDTSRIGGFTDDQDFNMRTDLEALRDKLSGSGTGWKIKENTTTYQRDPTNCGNYVALAMENEANGQRVGTDWESGPAWVNARKPRLAQKVWNFYSNLLKK